MSSPNNTLTNITPPRVSLIDERTGLISREWYRFFLSLFTLTGGGQNTTSLTDLQVGPPSVGQESITDINVNLQALQLAPSEESALEQIAVLQTAVQALALQSQGWENEIAEIEKQIQALALYVRPELGTMSQLQQAWLPWVTFDNAPEVTPPTVGTVAWDGGTTLGVQMTANVLGRVNEDGFYYVKASSAITKGDVVMFTGAVGSSGVPTGAPATGVTDGSYIMGIAAETMALNAFGLVQFQGTLKGLNTSAYSDGDILWYNPAVTGGLTKTKPSAPNVKVQMAAVINAGPGGSGSILIRVTAGSVLGGTDSNVQFGTLSNNDIIQYDSALQYWKNVAPSSVVVGTATNLAGGLANQIPFQTAPSTTSFSSALTWDGTTFTSGAHTVNGNILLNQASATIRFNTGGATIYGSAANTLSFTTDGTTEKLKINSNGVIPNGLTASSVVFTDANGALSSTGTVSIAKGGTGATTAAAAIENLLPSYTGNANKRLGLNGAATALEWVADGGGTVTSVGLAMPTQFTVTNSPVTSSGTLTASWNTQTANYVLAGPTTGAAAAPTFRALVSGDIPALSYVSSVGATAPITSTGGLTPTIGVTSSALTKVDDTNVTLTLGGSPTAALLAATSLTLGWTGQLSVARGGTGLSSYTLNGIVYAPSTGSLGTSADLTWNSSTLKLAVGGSQDLGGNLLMPAASPTITFNRFSYSDVASGPFTTKLVSTRVTYTVTPRMFVAVFPQYNSSTNSLSNTVRFRWEYQPGSELFVVYNDQRDTLKPGFPDLVNRAVIVKVNRLLRY